jgi:O-ureido-D-serine cyclo-ligase
MSLDVALVTSAALPDLDPDDRPLAAALAARGFSVAPVRWDAPGFDWAAIRMALVRSPWDYYQRYEEFLAWAAQVAAVTRLENPLPVLAWNLDKRYLAALAAAGAPVVPTALLERGTRLDVAALAAARGWERLVVKPAVSADSWETIVVERGELERAQRHLDRLLPERAMLVQPYLDAVETAGERCLVAIEGEISHAVRKNALTRGGRWAGLPEGVAVPIADDERRTALELLATARRLGGFAPTLYARVDLVRDREGRPRLLELELAEPTLVLAGAPAGLARLVAAIERRLAA